MLHTLAVYTIQVSNLVNYNCHPLKVGNNFLAFQTKPMLYFVKITVHMGRFYKHPKRMGMMLLPF